MPVRLLRLTAAITGLLAGLSLAGCGSGSSSGGMRPMMSASPEIGASSAGGGMMSGYAYSRLTCSAPTLLPGTHVTVMLADMGMSRMMSGVAPLGNRMMLHALPTTVRAGQVSFVVENVGWRTHELVVLPLAAGVAPGRRVPGVDGKVDENGGLGEASNSCAAGAGSGIAAGTVGWVTLTLAPGRYELLCNQPNHYADGMWQAFDVE